MDIQESPLKAYYQNAVKGNRDAQYELGKWYKYGYGTNEKNLELSFEWFEKSAEQGHSYAQLCLAWCYEFGDGCEKNVELAFKWFEESAKQGNTHAKLCLARCYESGIGCEKNAEFAFYLFENSSFRQQPKLKKKCKI